MSSDIAVRVEGLSKSYQIYAHPRDRLKQFVLPRAQRLAGRAAKNYYVEHSAVEDVSFEVRKGQTVGIVGRNGSGKSTLLQILCGTLAATRGRVVTHGRVAALLELGAGFNAEFTGRENVQLAAALYGLTSEETSDRLERIIAFADIGEYIDQPVKTFSSGMYVRLAFSVIAHVDADILVVDEALAVGDVFFQQKCMRYLKDFQENGGSILFVTHDTAAVLNLCDHAVLLSTQPGRRSMFGSAEEICRMYLEDLYRDPARAQGLPLPRGGLPRADGGAKQIRYSGAAQPNALYSVSEFHEGGQQFGEGKARITSVAFLDGDGRRLDRIEGDDEVSLVLEVKVRQRIVFPAFGFMLKNKLGEYLYTEGTDKAFLDHELVFEAGQTVRCTFTFVMPQLIQGTYSLNVAIAEGSGDSHVQQHWIHDAVILECVRSRLVHGYSGTSKQQAHIDVLVADDKGV